MSRFDWIAIAFLVFGAIATTAVYWAARDSLQARYEARMEALEAKHRQERREFELWKRACIEAVKEVSE